MGIRDKLKSINGDIKTIHKKNPRDPVHIKTVIGYL